MNIEITHELSRPGGKEKELSTFSSEMSLENFVDFTMDVSAGLDRLWLFNIQSAQQPVQLPPGNRLSF